MECVLDLTTQSEKPTKADRSEVKAPRHSIASILDKSSKSQPDTTLKVKTEDLTAYPKEHDEHQTERGKHDSTHAFSKCQRVAEEVHNSSAAQTHSPKSGHRRPRRQSELPTDQMGHLQRSESSISMLLPWQVHWHEQGFMNGSISGVGPRHESHEMLNATVHTTDLGQRGFTSQTVNMNCSQDKVKEGKQEIINSSNPSLYFPFIRPVGLETETSLQIENEDTEQTYVNSAFQNISDPFHYDYGHPKSAKIAKFSSERRKQPTPLVNKRSKCPAKHFLTSQTQSSLAKDITDLPLNPTEFKTEDGHNSHRMQDNVGCDIKLFEGADTSKILHENPTHDAETPGSTDISPSSSSTSEGSIAGTSCGANLGIRSGVLPKVTLTQSGVTVTLLNYPLWSAFSKVGTEMVINRGGSIPLFPRRMFPYLALSVSGLRPCGLYNVELSIIPASTRRFKYTNSKWIPVGLADTEPSRPPYIHPDSPNTGAHWNRSKIIFSKVKLTNNKESSDRNILLHSMQKYRVVTTFKALDTPPEIPLTFDFSETEFIAVTAYQNENVTQMKIYNNPFAKAFRDTSYHTTRRAGSRSNWRRDPQTHSGLAKQSEHSNRSLSKRSRTPRAAQLDHTHWHQPTMIDSADPCLVPSQAVADTPLHRVPRAGEDVQRNEGMQLQLPASTDGFVGIPSYHPWFGWYASFFKPIVDSTVLFNRSDDRIHPADHASSSYVTNRSAIDTPLDNTSGQIRTSSGVDSGPSVLALSHPRPTDLIEPYLCGFFFFKS